MAEKEKEETKHPVHKKKDSEEEAKHPAHKKVSEGKEEPKKAPPKHEEHKAPHKHEEHHPAPKHEEHKAPPKHEEHKAPPKHEEHKPEHKEHHVEHPAKHEVRHVVPKHEEHKPAHHVHHAAHPAVHKKRWREKWDNFVDGPFGILIYIALGWLLAMAVTQGLKPVLQTDTPIVAVFSESMVPTFEKGDMIFVQGGVQINQGDVIVFDTPDYKYPVIHRVTNITAEGVTTKGDHNLSMDRWVTPTSKVHGKAILKVPYLGWVKVLVYEQLGLVI